eukprot:1725640-Pyramimonas_sp.AAC.1
MAECGVTKLSLATGFKQQRLPPEAPSQFIRAGLLRNLCRNRALAWHSLAFYLDATPLALR